MRTNLTRIGDKARKEPTLVFTSLYHHVTEIDNLRSCYDEIDGRKAIGVDGVSKAVYGKNLEENLLTLSKSLKQGGYSPQPKRRTYVPKPGSEKGRPLGISCFEDKLVELAVKQVLEEIYEPAFEDSSYGYRPKRSQHDCLDALGCTIQQEKVSYLVEADIKSFLDRTSYCISIHERLFSCIDSVLLSLFTASYNIRVLFIRFLFSALYTMQRGLAAEIISVNSFTRRVAEI